MRIGIYNCYWTTRGGGERYAGTLGEILSRQNDVDLIGHESVSLLDLSEALGLDLSRASYRRWPSAAPAELSKLTADYDLFINSTFWSNLASKAAKSIYLVFFPQYLAAPSRLRLARFADSWLQRWPGPVAELIDGFYPPEGARQRWQWTRRKAVIRVPRQSFKQGQARLDFVPLGPRPLDQSLVDVRGPEIDWRIEDDTLVLDQKSNQPREVEIEIECRTFTPSETGRSDDTRSLGVCFEPGQPSGKLRTLARRLPLWLDSYRRRHDRSFLQTYDAVLAISQYTRQWIDDFWGVPNVVLPPPVDTIAFTAPEPGRKKPIILSVGRFFAGAHNKKHPAMLRAFRRMCDRGLLPDGWEFHLAGNVRRSAIGDLEYYAEVERLARGYPVKLLPDLPFSDLLEEYRSASIFWHATGWGESERRRPEKMEHFGLTTCEAMSSGCIPVVIAKAGQIEIVRDGVTGFLFRSEADLIRETRQLADGYGQPWMREMSAKATADALRYSKEAFEQKLLKILEAI